MSPPSLALVPPVAPRPLPVPFEPFAGEAPPRARGVDLAEARAALDHGRFWTEYQAIVHARTGRTCAFPASPAGWPSASRR